MTYVLHFLMGFSAAFIGLIAPGMLNMTAVRTTMEKCKKSGVNFSAGAASVVLVQASIALMFANFINENPSLLENLKVAAIIVFFMLSIFFFVQARKKFNVKGKTKRGNLFFVGMLMSSINMLAIPFYFGVSTYFKIDGQLIMDQPFISLFVIGSALGSFAVFLVYISFAAIISKRAKFIAANINYILSALFLVLGFITLIKGSMDI